MIRYAVIRYAVVAGLLALMLPSAPSFAVSAKDKMATCKFGADDQKLAGKKRADFIKNCMSSRNDPRGGAAAGTMGPSEGAPPKN